MRDIIALVALMLVCISCGCNSTSSSKDDIEQAYYALKGKRIQFPNNGKYIQGDIVSSQLPITRPLKVVCFIDSAGCVPCRLKLPLWESYQRQLDSIYPNSVDVILVIHPKIAHEIEQLIHWENYPHLVLLDNGDDFKVMNQLPAHENLHCFLLDDANSIMAIGNPLYNADIKSLYFDIINTLTNLSDVRHIDLGSFNADTIMSYTWVLHNPVGYPLNIQRIVASCDCISITASAMSIEPSDTASIFIQIKDVENGYFYRVVQLFTDITSDTPIELEMEGKCR